VIFANRGREPLWQAVSVRHPCPVCGSARGCQVQDNPGYACCENRPSDWPLTNGAWLHRTDVSGERSIGLPGESS
jgi:hypothetical protein